MRHRVNTLIQMLRFKRPMGSRTEHNFRKWFLMDLPNAWEDPYGNIHVLVARKDESWPTTIWSSHTDTVHKEEGYQKVLLDKGYIMLDPREDSNCLGADCTVGVWIMRELALAGVPGHYVFHWGEERGCIGSRKVVKEKPQYFRRSNCIIAFDRRGKDEIITFQRGTRTCSDAFAESLSAMLPKGYGKSDKGIYTDSAEYVDIIPECTNLGVGYSGEHGHMEMVDLAVPMRMVTALLANWDERNLVIERDPKAPKETTWGKWGKKSQYQHGFYMLKDGHMIKYGPDGSKVLTKDEQDELDKAADDAAVLDRITKPWSH